MKKNGCRKRRPFFLCISQSFGKCLRCLADILFHALDPIIGNLYGGAAGTDRGDGGTTVIIYGSSDAAVAQLVFLVIHCPALMPYDFQIALEF